jgi:hypothetical protein
MIDQLAQLVSRNATVDLDGLPVLNVARDALQLDFGEIELQSLP